MGSEMCIRDRADTNTPAPADKKEGSNTSESTDPKAKNTTPAVADPSAITGESLSGGKNSSALDNLFDVTPGALKKNPAPADPAPAAPEAPKPGDKKPETSAPAAPKQSGGLDSLIH